MRTLLDYAPVREYEDAVGTPHGREAVGDDDGRPPFEEGFESFFYASLGREIHAARRLVEDEYARLREKRASEGNKLSFSD